MMDRGEAIMSKKYLLVIDLQKQFRDKNGEYEKCLRYIEEHRKDYQFIFSTIFSQNIKEDFKCETSLNMNGLISHQFLQINPNYMLHLNWNGCQDVKNSDLEYIHPEDEKCIISKTGYSDNSKPPMLTTICFELDDEIHIIGCDLDACIMAICFQLWDAGFTNFKVLSEYCYTTAEDFTKDDVLKIMRRNFGNCII